MNKNKFYTIIYVFGRKEDQKDYNNDKVVSFVKIGQTVTECSSVDNLTAEQIKQDALKRCKQEARTAMPFVCKIFDCFISPNIKSVSQKLEKEDDKIRNILCNDIYNINNSKKNNRDLDPDDIPAGTEFVYDVTRSNIVHAIESYDHMFFTDCEVEDLQEIQKICQINSVGLDENIDNLSNDDDEKNIPLARKENFRFSLVDMKKGDKIKFMYDDRIAEVYDDRRIIYDGEIYSMTTFVRKFIPDNKRTKSEHYHGPSFFFTMDDVRLAELRAQMES